MAHKHKIPDRLRRPVVQARSIHTTNDYRFRITQCWWCYSPPASKHEHLTGKWIGVQSSPHQRRQSVEAPAQIGEPRREPNPRPARRPDHGRRIQARMVSSKAGSTDPVTPRPPQRNLDLAGLRRRFRIPFRRRGDRQRFERDSVVRCDHHRQQYRFRRRCRRVRSSWLAQVPTTPPLEQLMGVDPMRQR